MNCEKCGKSSVMLGLENGLCPDCASKYGMEEKQIEREAQSEGFDFEKFRPKEIYWLSGFLYVFLFLNAAEFLTSSINIEHLFSLEDSIVFQLLGGIGDDDLRYNQTLILYWVIKLLFISLTIIKANKISNWLWQQ